MRTILLALAIFSVICSSCNKEPEPLTKEQISRQIDSITQYRIREVDARAKTDLEYRMKIEVRAKVDSMVNAMTRPKDTAKAAPVPVPAAANRPAIGGGAVNTPPKP